MEPMEPIDLELTDEEFLALAKEAQYKDITFNEYINYILKEYIQKFKLEQTT